MDARRRCEAVLGELRANGDPDNVAGMARFGINPAGTLGVPMPVLRGVARDVKRELKRQPEERHALAAGLWASGVHEARILAALVDVPGLVTEAQMEAWAADLDSWDVCDQLCNNLFDKAPLAWEKAEEWAGRDEEFVKRAGFVLMTQLAVHDKAAPDGAFLRFLPLIEREAGDERNFVKKAVNWALRQIGKRNERLRGAALELAERLASSDPKAARWVGRDALRELRDGARTREAGSP